MNHLVTRNTVLAYMNVEENPLAVPQYRLMGDGFLKLSQAKTPTEYTRKFVNQTTETTDIIEYRTEVNYEADVYSRDPVIRRILRISDGERRGKSARSDIVTVYTDQIVAYPRIYKALKRQYQIIPQTQGDDVEVYRTTGRMIAEKEPVKGFFSLLTRQFKAESPYEGHSFVFFNRSAFNRGTIVRKEY